MNKYIVTVYSFYCHDGVVLMTEILCTMTIYADEFYIANRKAQNYAGSLYYDISPA